MRLCVFTSGGGTTNAAVLRAILNGSLQGIEPALLIQSEPNAKCRRRARDLRRNLGLTPNNFEILVINPKEYDSREAFGRAIIALLEKHSIDIGVMLGFIPYMPENVIQWLNRDGRFGLLNQHCAPLDPSFDPRDEVYDFGGKGMRGRAAVAARLFFVQDIDEPDQWWTEATVHMASEIVDRGPLWIALRCPIYREDDVDSLQKRLLKVEHLAVVATLAMLASGHARPFIRDKPLVQPEHQDALARAKVQARELYPNG